MSLLPSHWYYNTETGQLTRGNNLLNLGNNLVGGAGWHELNVPGNATEAQAASAAESEFPSGKTPTTAGITPARVASTAAGEAGAAIPSWVGAIEAFAVKLLPSRAFMIRAAEVVIGLGLIIVAVDELAKGTPVGDAAHAAGKAALIVK
jgi:hypothetical protein